MRGTDGSGLGGAMKRAFKVMMWAVLGLLAVLLLLAAVWVACNGRWADAAPQPVPQELQLQPVTLAPADNAFFDMQGLRAPAAEPPNAWGQRSWQAPAADAAGLLDLPSGGDWGCNSLKEDCVARWRAAAAVLTQQRADAHVFGARCSALAARTAYQEPPPMRRPGQAPHDVTLPQFSGVTTCLRWLQMDAVLAPDARHARAAWAQADALLRLFASGSRTLISQAIGWASVQRHQVLLAQWSARQPQGDTLPAAWLAPMPERLLQPRFWMATESHFQRNVMMDMASATEAAWYSDAPNALQAWFGRWGLGYLPNLTVQTRDAYWLADLRAYGHLQGLALAQQLGRMAPHETPGWPALLWRNGVGNILIEVAGPALRSYPLRQADLALYQAALELSQRLNAVPAGERAAWWQRQPLDAGLRERLRLDGDTLLVRGWRGDAEPDHQAPVRFPLRPA